MANKNPYCLIRNLDNPNQTATNIGIDCFKLFERINKGEFGDHWQLEECVENPLGSASLLRVVARSKPGIGIEIVHDKNFEEYFKDSKDPIPDSRVIDLILERLT